MAKNFKLTIQTPEGTILSKDVTSITLHPEDGQIQVLAKHTSFITSINHSKVRIEVDGVESDTLLCRNAVFTFNNVPNEGTLIAEYCKFETEVSTESITEYLKFLEEQLAKGNDLSQFQLVYLENERFAVKKMIK